MWNIILAGVLLNFCARLLNIKGIDAMPALPVIAGYLYGSSAGAIAGLVIAASYYILNPRSIHYAPLIVSTSALSGFLAPLFSGLGIFAAGIIILALYHIASGFIASIFGGLGPRYMLFAAANIAASAAIFYISSFAL